MDSNRPHPNFVAGEWRDGADSSLNENPSDLDQPLGRYAVASPADVADAVEAASAAAPVWEASTAAQRADVLERVARELAARQEELGELLASEEGKTLAEGVGEVARAAAIFSYYAAEAYRANGELLPSGRTNVGIEVRRRPVGVIGVITPWNFPIAIPAWKIAPALAHGNTVVFKPADSVPGSAWALSEILSRSGLPAGAFNLVMGSGRTVGEAIIQAPGVAGISFTGSDGIGRHVAATAAARLAKVQLELGGKNPAIVLDDANLDLAVSHVLNGAFLSTGQRCTASSRIIVTRGVHDEFVELLAARTRELRTGHALDPSTQLGPVANRPQLEKNLEYIEIGKREGATPVVEGRVLEHRTRGYYLSPTLFVDPDPRSRINREEIFGPVASVIEAADYDEALSLANEGEFGLVAALMTNSLKRVEHFKRHARFGMLMVNLPTAGQEYQAPFGGAKGSGYGAREQGTYAKEFFTDTYTCYVTSG